MNIKVIEEGRFHREIFKSAGIIRESLADDGPFLISQQTVIDDFIQKYIILSDGEEIHSRVIRPLLLDALLSSESLSAGSAEICLKIISDLIDETSKKNKSGIPLEKIEKERSGEMACIKKNLNIHTQKFNKSDILKLINKKFNLDVQKNIAKEIIERSNIKSPFFLTKSDKKETILSFLSGYNFKVEISPIFLPASKKWERTNVSVLIIDGMVETTGEIHHLLERANRKKESIVIFVRSLSEEVRSTISLNVQRGTIDLIPIEVGFDENTLNILNDISICCNSDIVSSQKGDLISSACQKDLVKIDKIILTPGGINILNDHDSDAIAAQLKYLMHKRDECRESEIKRLFDRRVRSLTSGNIEIKIGTTLLQKDPQTIEKFDKFFREVKSLVISDVVYRDKFIDNRFFDYLKEDYPYSSSLLYFSLKHAFSFVRTLFSVKRALISES